MAAVIGLQQLDYIAPLIERHRANGRFFDEALRGIAGIAPASVVDHANPSYWLYTLLADDCDEVERILTSAGISASKLHRPNHYHSVFKPFVTAMPGLDDFYRKLVHIPCGWWVSDEDRERIVETLKRG
ncbi:DegT/DnrJ/EryC1/StrS aminotransferase family protein [compost metagenome]